MADDLDSIINEIANAPTPPDAWDILQPHMPTIDRWANDDLTPYDMLNRLKAMNVMDTQQFERFERDITQIIKAALKRADAGNVTIGTININNIENSPNANLTVTTAQIAPEVKPEPPAADEERSITLDYRRIKDDRLSFTDRIIFSFCWKWAYCNREHPHKIAIQKFRKATGFRHNTVVKSLGNLITWGYVTDKHVPCITKLDPDGKHFKLNNGMEYFGFDHIEWMPSGNTKGVILEAVTAVSRRRGGNSWKSAKFGVNRTTAWRRSKTSSACNGCNTPVTDATGEVEPMQRKSGTDATQIQK